jgi:prepilin-type N-terminal cleavage/methylation domain-containing protein
MSGPTTIASSPSRTTERGFTLTELAVVVFIVGLLISGAIYTVSAQMEQRMRESTQRTLEEARELLVAFALVNGRLPCPATCNDAPKCSLGSSSGDENPAGGGACVAPYSGFLPAKAIGFRGIDNNGFARDAWGNLIRYAVSSTTWSAGAGRFTTSHSPTGASAWSVSQAPADLQVCTQSQAGATCAAGQAVTNPNTVVAVIFSTGKNLIPLTTPAGADEQENVDGTDGIFVWHDPRPTGATSGGEFDDLVTWIPVSLLYGRMVAAGVLP